ETKGLALGLIESDSSLAPNFAIIKSRHLKTSSFIAFIEVAFHEFEYPMKKIFLLSIFLLLLSYMSAFAQDMPVSEFVRKLESRYYNPLRCGLADYHCEIDDALLENLISALSKGHPANKPLFR